MKKELKQLLEGFKKDTLARFQNEILSITLFGSHARGDAQEDSDVDVLIVTKSSDWHWADKIGEIAYNILLKTGTYISTKVISQQHYDYLRQIHSPFIENVLKEGHPV